MVTPRLIPIFKDLGLCPGVYLDIELWLIVASWGSDRNCGGCHPKSGAKGTEILDITHLVATNSKIKIGNMK